MIKKAEHFAKKIYKDKYRLSGESLLSHATRVRDSLVDIGVEDKNILIASLLHHVISDNMVQHIESVKSKFGEEVNTTLEDFDKISNLSITIDSPNNLNKDYIIQTYLNLSNDLNVLLILLADKVQGSKTLHALDYETKLNSSNRSLYIYAPICRLVGLGKFASELEKNAFRTLYPSEFYKIRNILRQESLMTRNYLKNIRDLLIDHLKDKGINAVIGYRIKSEYSIFNKALGYKEENKFEGYDDIKDVAALRIIVDTVEECYVVEDLLKELWEMDPNERDDYIANPKPAGYRSLHNIFFIEKDFPLEVQIRTEEMHDENEFGNASHIFYKHGDKFRKYLGKNPDWLKTLNYNQAKEVSDLQHFSDKVYPVTPKGDIIELPRGSSVLDFAYEIHEEMGNRCVGGFVNGNIKKLSYKVQDGEAIEIRTTNKNNVSRDWLEIVVTPKAKKSIRRVLREKNGAKVAKV